MKLKIGNVTLDPVLNLSVVKPGAGAREEVIAVGDVNGKRERLSIPTDAASAELVFDTPLTMIRASEATPAAKPAPAPDAKPAKKQKATPIK